MSRTRGLPVLLALFVLLGADALWVMTHTSSEATGTPVVIRHSRLEGVDYYRGEVLLSECGQLRGGIAAGSSSEVNLDLSIEESSGSCSVAPQSFALMYDSGGDEAVLVGVNINGAQAPFEVLEEN